MQSAEGDECTTQVFAVRIILAGLKVWFAEQDFLECSSHPTPDTRIMLV